MLYFQSHVAHVNITGRNFMSDHKILKEIYEDAQENIDAYAEYLRICDTTMPDLMEDVTLCSEIQDGIDGKSADAYLNHVYDIIEIMLDCLKIMYDVAEEEDELGLSNYIQDRIDVHRKQCWKLRSILEI
jgi:DNA-binding ferritin-like protein